MNYKLHIRVAVTLLLALLLGACNLPNPQAPEAPEAQSASAEPAPTAQAPTESVVLCANPLFPVEPGASWTYSSTGSLSGSYSFTNTITDVREDGFTLTTKTDGNDLSQEWVCRPEGLASPALGNGIGVGISTLGVQMDLATSNVQGVILPRTVSPGDQWPYSLDFDGTMQYNQYAAGTQGTATFTFNAIGEESITVPAGTFNAMKIHVDMTLDMQVTYSGLKIPAQFTSGSDIWFAPGVGWVKAASTGALVGSTYSENLELQSYTIP
jgi:hypothetical protein